MSKVEAKLRCRLSKLRFARGGIYVPCLPDDVCQRWVFPEREGSARLALCAEDIAAIFHPEKLKKSVE